MYIIAPSLLEADFNCLKDQLIQMEEGGAGYVHIDVMDGQFVPNLSFGMKMIQSIRRSTNLTLDVHMMVLEPARFAQRMKKAGADVLTIHYEACKDIKQSLKYVRSIGLKAGIALKPQTPLDVIDEEIIELVDVVHLMTVEPGLEGQKFLRNSIGRISDLKSRIKKAGDHINIEVDGGINIHNACDVLRSGANVIVSGKALFDGNLKNNIMDMVDALDAVEAEALR